MNCLMIETRDKRKFFTHEKNFPMLIDFAKTFNADISVVKLQEGQVLELSELAPAICDAAYKRPRSSYELLEMKLTPKSNDRPTILKNAERIQGHIVEQFKTGKVVSLGELKDRFRKLKLTTACYCNHIHKVMKTLQKEGMKFNKIGAGKYKVAE